MIYELNERSKEIFRSLVDAYCETGEPVGSHTLCERMKADISSATIRNVMAQLERLGLLYSPHTSAGRVPTEAGLSFFINSLIEIGALSEEEKLNFEKHYTPDHPDIEELLGNAVSTLSGLSRCVSLVFAPKQESPLKHIEFVALNNNQALVILVNQDGTVENRILTLPQGFLISTLQEASNFLNARLIGKNLNESRKALLKELKEQQNSLDDLVKMVVEAGLGIWSGEPKTGRLIVTGQSHLLEDVTHLEDLERLRLLFSELETKENVIRLLDAAIAGEGVQIFIGSNNPIAGLSGTSLIVSPYRNNNKTIIGALGIIGPRHLNYGRIIPLVDYTAKMISRMIDF